MGYVYRKIYTHGKYLLSFFLFHFHYSIFIFYFLFFHLLIFVFFFTHSFLATNTNIFPPP